MIRFQAEALHELETSAQWYEEQRPGLGAEFLECVQSALDRIEQEPDVSVAATDNLRRVLVHRFPYSIFFRREDEVIRVFAIAHGRRRSGYWHGRLS